MPHSPEHRDTFYIINQPKVKTTMEKVKDKVKDLFKSIVQEGRSQANDISTGFKTGPRGLGLSSREQLKQLEDLSYKPHTVGRPKITTSGGTR